MKVSILYNSPGEEAGLDDLDTMDQVRAITGALESLGIESREFPVPRDFNLFREMLRQNRDELIFNLTDPLAGEGRFITLCPLAMEQENRTYTGCSADALYTTSNKVLAKKIMNMCGIPTACSLLPDGPVAGSVFKAGRFIAKSVWEHSSQGLNRDSVFDASSPEEVMSRLSGGETGFFAESFLPGREINIGLLQNETGAWTTLAPSEILYTDPSDPAPFLDYRSKWEEDSSAYKNSARSLEFTREDHALLDKLTAIALNCADTFALGGYARVDFRLDEENNPMVMEVNANPCLSPGSGFVSAVEKSGITYPEMINRIIHSSRQNRKVQQ